MEPAHMGLMAAAGLLLLLAAGVPVAVSLGLTGLGGLWWVAGPRFALSMAQTLPYAVVAKYAWAVLPLFVLMGSLAAASGITMDLFRAANLWLSRLRGGLYLAVIAGSAGFAAASGSTVVNAVVFTRLALPEMIRHGYSRSLSLGCICAAGTFAAMIPPSLTMVIYAIIVGGLFFSRFLVVAGAVDAFANTVSGFIHSAGGVLVVFSLMYIVLGCFLDTASMMVITLPFVFPVVTAYGIDPIWFGIIFVKVIEISVITPPVGLNLYAVMSAAGKDAAFGDLAKGVVPFLAVDLVTLALLVVFPELSLWLPGLMG